MFLEKSVIIEFNGLPATGKTTIANRLSSILKHEKILHQRSYVRRWWEKFGRTVFVDPCCSSLFYLLLRFANQIIPRKSRLTHIGGELYHYRTYRNFLREKKTPSVLIIDQGLIQSIISIAHLDVIEKTDVLARIFEYYKKKNICFIRVDCLVDEHIACERLTTRKKNSARLHNVSHSELYSAMRCQAENFTLVRGLFSHCCPDNPTIVLDETLAPEVNAELIFSKLIEYGVLTK